MDWIILVLAGLFEVGWAVGLKYSDGLSRLWPTLVTVASMTVSLTLLGIALKSLPLGTAYTVWTGIGAIGTVVLGIALFGESTSLARLACVGLIVVGIVGLKVVTPSKPAEAAAVEAPAAR
jgi:quaternary ammonium compound-resistance protein SugE